MRHIEEAIFGLFTLEAKYQAVLKSDPDYSGQSDQVPRPKNCSDDDFEVMIDYLKEIGKDRNIFTYRQRKGRDARVYLLIKENLDELDHGSFELEQAGLAPSIVSYIRYQARE